MTPRYRRILIATDFSAGSRTATRHVVRLFPTRSAIEIHLVHVLEPLHSSPPPPLWEDYQKARERHARRRLVHIAAGLRQQLGAAANISVHVPKGTAYDAICRVASRLRVDLLILGTHGRTGLPHFLLGSVAERVVRHAGRPVLVVPARTHGGRQRQATR